MSEQTGIDEKIAELAAECALDPLAWSHEAYAWGVDALQGVDGPREWQADTFRIIRDHLSNPDTRFQPCQIAVASGHGIGKSACIGMLVNWAMSTCVDAKVVITANTETQVVTKTSPEVGKWARLAITEHWFNVSAQSIAARDDQHTREWRTNFVTWSKSNTESFAGLHNAGRRIVLIFDEASAIDDKVWEVAEGALTDENTEIIWIAFGNPTRNTGRFRECFGKFRHRWHTRQIDSRTVPGTNRQQLQKWVDDYGEDSDFVRVRVRGQFPNASFNALLGPDDVEAAMSRDYPPGSQAHAAIILGVDIARQGDDSSVIMRRQGHCALPPKVMRIPDTMMVASQVSMEIDNSGADATFVDATGGYGVGVVDALRQINRDPVEVYFSGKALDPRYFNKRSEMYFELAKWVKDGGSLPDDPELKEELCALEYSFQGDKFRLIDKDDIKELIGRSPDKSDALALTFAYPVSPRNPMAELPGYSSHRRESAQRGHNPFDLFKKG